MKSKKYNSYLELGVDTGNNFSNIQVANLWEKRGVDIEPIKGHFNYLNARIFIGTTNQFFRQTSETFDLIFIDADHERKQFLQDVNNSLLILNPGGTIVCHDCLPVKENHQKVPRVSEQWTGNVWKGWMDLRNTRADLQMCVIDQDWGCGLIQFGKQKCMNVKESDLTWSNFKVRKKKWLSIVKEIPIKFRHSEFKK
tara:strand:- start:18228 stop:18818 length:591 start_codon:yes stop_codon:yes gene_type:complete